MKGPLMKGALAGRNVRGLTASGAAIGAMSAYAKAMRIEALSDAHRRKLGAAGRSRPADHGSVAHFFFVVRFLVFAFWASMRASVSLAGSSGAFV